jgi:hypothetical protein
MKGKCRYWQCTLATLGCEPILYRVQVFLAMPPSFTLCMSHGRPVIHSRSGSEALPSDGSEPVSTLHYSSCADACTELVRTTSASSPHFLQWLLTYAT